MNIVNIKAKGKKYWQFFALWLISLSAQARLPTPVNPTSGAPNGNYLAFMEGWTSHGLATLILTLIVIGGLLSKLTRGFALSITYKIPIKLGYMFIEKNRLTKLA